MSPYDFIVMIDMRTGMFYVYYGNLNDGAETWQYRAMFETADEAYYYIDVEKGK